MKGTALQTELLGRSLLCPIPKSEHPCWHPGNIIEFTICDAQYEDGSRGTRY